MQNFSLPFWLFSTSACCGWAQISYCHSHSPVWWQGRACLWWHITTHAMLSIDCLCLCSAPRCVAVRRSSSYHHHHLRVKECLYCLVYCISKRIQQMMSISSWLFCLIYWKMCQPIWVCQPSLQFKHPTDMKLTSALLKIEFQRKTLLFESTCLLVFKKSIKFQAQRTLIKTKH